ncbi:MAG: putative membrane protein YeaQ/YmgE (transglycosylase-associated protein family), partial [Planctomycetota bacterium]
MEIIYFLLIGSVAGWLAGQLMKGRGFGLFSNMVIGVLGAVLGGYLFR